MKIDSEFDRAVASTTKPEASSGPRSLPAWHVLALVSGLGALALSAGPISDHDVYWHTLAGEYVLHGRGFPHPDPWSFSLPGARWHSTSMLSEAVLALVFKTVGYGGLVGVRAILSVALMVMLYRMLVVGRSGWPGAAVFTLVALPLTVYLQERPQTASLLFLVWLAGVCRRYQSSGEVPVFWRFIAVSYLWALVHGLFVLAPGCLVLLAAGAFLDDRHGRAPEVRRLLVLAGSTVVACALTPMGPRLLLAPFTVGSAARGFITEWAPTTLTYSYSWGFAACMGLVVLAWARSRDSVSRSEVLWMVALSAFGFLAVRNAGPASILLAPLAVERLSGTWRVATSQLRVRRLPAVALATLAFLAVTLSYVTYPAVPRTNPSRIAERLATQPVQLRVLNDYNISGYLLREASPHLLLAVDGRTDRYGRGFLSRYDDAFNVRKGWQEFVAAQRVDAAVVLTDEPLAQLLVSELGWHIVLVDQSWSLLSPPSSNLL